MSVSGTAAGIQDAQVGAAIGGETSPSGAFLSPTAPNLVDFLTFLATSVQIPSAALAVNSPWPGYALTQAIGITLSPPNNPAPILYVLACYNCATHILFSIAPDVPGQNYFQTARSSSANGFGLIQATTGLVQATSDEVTSASLTAPEWASRLTVGQLAFFKTPWGREYLSYQQSYGPSIVGLS